MLAYATNAAASETQRQENGGGSGHNFEGMEKNCGKVASCARDRLETFVYTAVGRDSL